MGCVACVLFEFGHLLCGTCKLIGSWSDDRAAACCLGVTTSPLRGVDTMSALQRVQHDCQIIIISQTGLQVQLQA